MVLAKTDADAEIQIAMNSKLSLEQKLGTKPVTLKIDHIPPHSLVYPIYNTICRP